MRESGANFLKGNIFPTILLNKQGDILRINEKLPALLNISAEKLLNSPLLSLFKLKTPTSEADLFTLPLDSLVYADFNIEGYAKIPVQLFISAPDDQQLITVIVAKNENDHYNSKIFNSLNQLNLAVEGANIGIWQYDIASQNVFFSVKFRQLINLTKPVNMIVWQDFIELIHPEDRDIFCAFFKNHRENEIPLDFEFRVLIKSKIHWFRIKGDIFYHDQQKHCIMGILLDITAAKDTLHELNQVVISKK